MEAPALYLIKLAPFCSKSQIQSSLNWHLMGKCKHCKGMELMGHDVVLTLHSLITSSTGKCWIWIFCLLLNPSSFSKKRTRQLLRRVTTCRLSRYAPVSAVLFSRWELWGSSDWRMFLVLFCWHDQKQLSVEKVCFISSSQVTFDPWGKLIFEGENSSRSLKQTPEREECYLLALSAWLMFN